jgi:hypothetical protein
MALSQNPAHSASGGTSVKLFYGFVIPLLLFIILQPVLLTVTDGTGGFEGMGVVLVAPFLWIWLFIGLLFFPLIASAVHTARRRSG